MTQWLVVFKVKQFHMCRADGWNVCISDKNYFKHDTMAFFWFQGDECRPDNNLPRGAVGLKTLV